MTTDKRESKEIEALHEELLRKTKVREERQRLLEAHKQNFSESLQKLLEVLKEKPPAILAPKEVTEIVEVLHEIEEDVGVVPGKEKPSPLKPAMHSTLTASLSALINEYSPLTAVHFRARFEPLIEEHGFAAFKNAFDDLLIDKQMVKKFKRHTHSTNAIREINQYLIDTTGVVYSALLLESSKKLAEGILDIYKKDASLYVDKAREKAKGENYKTVKELAKEVVKKEESDVLEQKKQLDAIDAMEEMPLDFYIEKLRIKEANEAREPLAKATAPTFNTICALIREDILSQKSLDKRVIVLERYILVAAQFIDEGKPAAAAAIFTALQASEVHRLYATHNSLSPGTQEALKSIKTLFSSADNFGAIKKYTQDHNTYLLPNYVLTFMEFSKDNNPKVDRNGAVVQSLLAQEANKKVIAHFEKLLQIEKRLQTEALPHDSRLFTDISKALTKETPKTEEDRTKRLYDLSLVFEPRDVIPVPSKVMKSVKTLMQDSPVTRKLPSVISNLMMGFDPKELAHFESSRDSIILEKGFEAFKDVFDDILIDRSSRKRASTDSQYARALHEIDQYLVDTMMSTFSSMVSEGAKIHAQGILDVFYKPPKELVDNIKNLLEYSPFSYEQWKESFEKEEREECAKVDGSPEEREKEIAKIKNNASMKVAALNLVVQARQLADADNYSELRTVLKANLRKQRMAELDIIPAVDKDLALEQMESDLEEQMNRMKLPLDYYIEKVRLSNLNSKKIASLTAEYATSTNALNKYIREDLLASSSLDKRTLVLERYVLMAEKFMKANHLDEAYTIYLAVNGADISRLKTTQDGLTRHAKETLARMDELFNPSKNDNSKKWRADAAANKDMALSPTHVVKDLTFLTENSTLSGLVTLDETGRVTVSLKDDSVIEKIIVNCRKIEESNSVLDETIPEKVKSSAKILSAKIKKDDENFGEKIKDDFKDPDDYFFQKSLKQEPRLVTGEEPPRPSSIAIKLKGVMRDEHGLFARIEHNIAYTQSKMRKLEREIKNENPEYDNNAGKFHVKLLSVLLHIQTALSSLFKVIQSLSPQKNSDKTHHKDELAKKELLENAYLENGGMPPSGNSSSKDLKKKYKEQKEQKEETSYEDDESYSYF